MPVFHITGNVNNHACADVSADTQTTTGYAMLFYKQEHLGNILLLARVYI